MMCNIPNILLFVFILFTVAILDICCTNTTNTTNISTTNSTESIATNETEKDNSNLTTVTANRTFNSNISTTRSTTFDKCILYSKWTTDVYTDNRDCLAIHCRNRFLDLLVQYMNCSNWKVAEQVQMIASKVAEYLLLRAALIREENYGKPQENIMNYEIVERKYFRSEYGFIVKSFQDSYEPLIFKAIDGAVKISFPPTELQGSWVAFQFTVFDHVYILDKGVKHFITSTPLSEAVKGLKSIPTKSGTKYFNSKIVSLTLDPPKSISGDFIEIYFKFPNYKNLSLTNHKCIHTNGLGSDFWTDGSCHEHIITESSITCRCSALTGSYAILSEIEREKPKENNFQRSGITTLLLCIGFLGLLFSLLCLLLPYMTRCSHIGGMLKIYRLSDIVLAMECLLLIYGVFNSSNIDKADLVAAALHYLQTSAMVWVLMEGFFLYHGILPLFQGSTSITFFFGTIGFGLPAGLAGGATGYSFGFDGKSEFVWAKASGSNATFFYLPTLVIVFILVIFNVVLIYELLSWIGNKDDYSYARSVKFLKRANGYIFVMIVTNYLGISAQSSGDSFYAYLFVGFFAIQIICQFYSHFISNYEVWDYRKKEKQSNDDEEEIVDNEKDNESNSDDSFDNIKRERDALDDLVLPPPTLLSGMDETDRKPSSSQYEYYEDGVDRSDTPSSTTDSEANLAKSSRASSSLTNADDNVFESKSSIKSQESTTIPEDAGIIEHDTLAT